MDRRASRRSDTRRRVLRAARACPGADAATIAAAARCHPSTVQRHLKALRPAGGSLLKQRRRAAQWRVSQLGAVVLERGCPARVLDLVACRGDSGTQSLIPSQPATSVLTFARLAGSDDPAVRMRAAESSRCPPHLAARLSRDRAPVVCYAAHRNPNLPPVLIRAAARGDSGARVAVAANPACPAAVLARLADIGGHSINVALAENPACPAAVLARLSYDSSFEVKDAVAMHRGSPPEVLERLSGDIRWEIQHSVAANPNTPRPVLERLAGRSQDSDVSGAAQRSLTGAGG